MFRLSCWFLVALLFSVQCIQRQILYSRLDTQVTNSPAAVLLGDVDSVVHCAGLCYGDDNCAEFLYNQTDRQCIGLHCLKKGSYSYQYVVSASDQKLYFGKEINWVEYSGHYYFYGEQNVTWTDAKLECQKICAYLVEIETIEESDWLAATFLMKDSCSTFTQKHCTAWTGGNDIDTEGLFVWDRSNTTFGFTNWTPNNPSPVGSSDAVTRDCVDLFRNGKWNDRQCSHLNPFICEKTS